jgi:hypothetical protein
MKIKWLCIASGILLLLAVPSLWPYDFYILLRWFIFISSIIVAWGFYKSKLTVWIFVFISVAFLFNPIIPIHLVKSSWVLIDFVSAVLFFLAAFVFKEKEFK